MASQQMQDLMNKVEENKQLVSDMSNHRALLVGKEYDDINPDLSSGLGGEGFTPRDVGSYHAHGNTELIATLLRARRATALPISASLPTRKNQFAEVHETQPLYQSHVKQGLRWGRGLNYPSFPEGLEGTDERVSYGDESDGASSLGEGMAELQVDVEEESGNEQQQQSGVVVPPLDLNSMQPEGSFPVQFLPPYMIEADRRKAKQEILARKAATARRLGHATYRKKTAGGPVKERRPPWSHVALHTEQPLKGMFAGASEGRLLQMRRIFADEMPMERGLKLSKPPRGATTVR